MLRSFWPGGITLPQFYIAATADREPAHEMQHQPLCCQNCYYESDGAPRRGQHDFFLLRHPAPFEERKSSTLKLACRTFWGETCDVRFGSLADMTARRRD